MKSDQVKAFDVSVTDLARVDSWFRAFRRLECLEQKCERVLRLLQSGIGNDPDHHCGRVDFDGLTYWESVLKRLRELKSYRLDKISVIPSERVPDPNWTDDEEWLDLISAELRSVLQKSHLTEAEERVTEQLAQIAAKSQRSEYVSRMLLELSEAQEKGRYCVWWTLSIEDRYMGEVFGEGSRAFEMFIQRLKRACPGEFCYIAFPELGGETGRPHYHMLSFHETLPAGVVDPNAVWKGKGWLREIDALKSFWRFGMIVSPVAVRWSGDRYAEDGWYWPSEPGHPGVPIKSNRSGVAYYMTKYVTKDTEGREWKKSGYRQRVRMSRGFGLSKIKERLDQMSDEELKATAIMPVSEVKCGRLLKVQARLKMLKRLFGSVKDDRRSLTTFRDAASSMSPRTSLYRRLLSSMRGIPVCSVRNATQWQASITVETLCEIAKKWQQTIVQWLAESQIPIAGVTKVPNSTAI